MPLFEFSCKKCGHVFEELLSQTELENQKMKCPACASKQVERGFSAFSSGNSGTSSDGLGSMGGCGSGSGGFT